MDWQSKAKTVTSCIIYIISLYWKIIRDFPGRTRRLPSGQLKEHLGERPHGGVVTQRIANPCTPVRFRMWPPIFFLYFIKIIPNKQKRQTLVRD